MNPQPSLPEAWGVLFTAAAEGPLDATQRAQLNELLRSDPAARREFIDYMSVHALLAWRHGGVPPLEMPLAGAAVSPRHTSRRWGLAALAGALAAVAAGLAVFFYSGRHPGAARPIAVVVAQQDAHWDDGRSLAVNLHLRPGRQQIASGTAHLELSSGVIVSLRGPVDFEVISPTRLHLHRGALRAYSPLAARGFTVTAPRGVQVVDLGTEFAVLAGEQSIEIHVFDGRVSVNGDREIMARQAIHIDSQGKIHTLVSSAALFPPLYEALPTQENSP